MTLICELKIYCNSYSNCNGLVASIVVRSDNTYEVIYFNDLNIFIGLVIRLEMPKSNFNTFDTVMYYAFSVLLINNAIDHR